MTDYLGSVALPSMKQRQKKLCQVKMKARAEPVYNDSSNFGVRMLEKLGWSEGKGLGKREDGMSAPILPKMKQDSEGFGYAGEKDDHWTQHDQDFNQLLKSLNGGAEEDEGQGLDEVDMAKMKSLEEKSKNSRARVHYKKFTRGKDLSRASEKDLANIFGKKSLEEVNIQIVGGEVVQTEEVEEEVEPSEDRNVLGLTTIKSAVSVQDYFKKKMQEKLGMKADTPVEAAPEEPERKKSKKSKRKLEEEKEPEAEVEQEPEELPKKKKKRSKNEEPKAEVAQEVEETPRKKSKKDKKRKTEETQETVEEQSSLEQLEQPVEQKSKKGKRKASDDNEKTVEDATSLEQVDEPPKKKSKKKKRKQSEDEQPAEVEAEEVPEAPSTEGKKKKKEKKAEEQQQNDEDDDEVTCRVKATG